MTPLILIVFAALKFEYGTPSFEALSGAIVSIIVIVVVTPKVMFVAVLQDGLPPWNTLRAN